MMELQEEISKDMERTITDVFRMFDKVKENYPEDYLHLNLTKIAISIFLQKRKEKMFFARLNRI